MMIRVLKKIVHRLIAIPRFILFYLKELIAANLIVAYDALTPQHLMHPGVISVPLTKQHNDFGLLVLTNLISMTPGTFVLDVSQDRKKLFIHAMYLDNLEEFREKIRTKYEHFIWEIFS